MPATNRPITPPAVEPASLRVYQKEALAAWEAAGRRGVVALPTPRQARGRAGAGKTHVALAAMACVGRAALVLVPTRVLLAQWVGQIGQIYRGDVGVVGDGERCVRPITVCTFESAFRRMDEFGDRFELLVVDEVHHFGGGARAEALEMCAAPARLGLTATPPEELAHTDRLVGPIVYEKRIGEMTGRHLAPFDHVRRYVALTDRERAAYAAAYGPFLDLCRRFRRTDPGAGWAQLVRAASASEAGRRAIEGFHAARRIVSTASAKLRLVRDLLAALPGDRVFVFTADNAAAYRLSTTLLVPTLTCDIGRRERADVLERLRQGRLRAVVSSRVLNEGVDLPEARVGIILGGTMGGREQVQRVGRLLRPAAGKSALVHEIVVLDTFETHQSRRRGEYLVS